MKRLARMLIVMLLANLWVLDAAAGDDFCSNPVSTAEGLVSGVSEKEQPVCSYKGIPYAAPPVGNLRWAAPQPPAAREGVFKAEKFPPECCQTAGPLFGVKASKRSEDCLYLNIWRPKKSGRFPVMLWIHGGTFNNGSGVIPLYRGDRIAGEKDVVAVTINYRLDFLGFLAYRQLSQEDPNGSSGNYGLMDQIAALKWVKQNIAAFGGDPDNITIFGESAGGWSVCSLLASPLASGLFSKAIIESGGCDAVTSMEKGYEIGDEFAKAAGCEGPEALACLRSQTFKELRSKFSHQEKKEKKLEKKAGSSKLVDIGEIMPKWIPRVDGWVLKQKPIDALRAGRFNRTPLLVGVTRDEVKLFTLTIPGIRLVPKCILHQQLELNLGEEITEGIERLYPYDQYRRPADAVIDALGDMGLGCRCFEAAEAASAYQPVYYYRFDYDQHLLPHMAGAMHGIEIPFVLDNFKQPPAIFFFPGCFAKKARPLKNEVMIYWTNFAKTGDPNEEQLTQWPKYDTRERNKMILDQPLRQMTTDNVEKCQFWKEHDFLQEKTIRMQKRVEQITGQKK